MARQTEAPYYPVAIDGMNAMLDKADLKASLLKIAEQTRKFENRTELKKWARGWAGCMPILEVIPQDKREAFIEELLQAYVDQIPCATDGSTSYSISNLICVAYKKDEKNE